MTTTEQIEITVPNPDCCMLPREVAEMHAEAKAKAKGLLDFASYCEAKENAMCCRLNGKIEMALKFEAAADAVYARLPKWAKW